MLQRRMILIMLVGIFILSGMSFVSLLWYFDPFSDELLAIFLLLSSFILMGTSFLSLLLYFFKKIYFRGGVSLYNVFSSLRQAFLFCIYCIGIIILGIFNIPYILPGILLACILIFVELLIQSL